LYIGKGKGSRYLDHLKVKDVVNPIFKNKIKHWIKNNVQEQIVMIQTDIIIENNAFELEKSIIKDLGRLDNKTGILLNLTDGGDGVSGREPWNKGKKYKSFITEEGRARLSAAHTGKILSVETKQKMSNYWKGKTYTEETKRKISESLKGNIPWNKGKTNIYTDETLEKMRESSKQTYIDNPKLRDRMRELNLGKKMPEETKRKISASTKGKPKSEATKRLMSERKKEYWRKWREKRENNTN